MSRLGPAVFVFPSYLAQSRGTRNAIICKRSVEVGEGGIAGLIIRTLAAYFKCNSA